MPVEHIVFFAALYQPDTIGIIRLGIAVFFGNDIASVPSKNFIHMILSMTPLSTMVSCNLFHTAFFLYSSSFSFVIPVDPAVMFNGIL